MLRRKINDPREYYLKGGWNVICDRCGSKKKNNECRMEWDNLFVCVDGCWEKRQPMDYLRAYPDHQNVPIPRPDGPPVYVEDD